MKRLIATGLVVAAAVNLWAQAPEMFRYQGRLASGATLVNATLPMSFKLYNAPSGGTKLYEDSNSVAVVNGLYSTYVGDNTVFGSLTNAMTNAAVYLELTINGETLSPRERLVSVPYALNAGASSANQTPSGTIVLSPTYPNPELAAQGYSIYQEDVMTADWQEIVGRYPWPDMGISPLFIGHNNQLWAFANDMGGEPSAFTTADGKQWTPGKLPPSFSGYSLMMDETSLQILSHGGKVFLFQKGVGRDVWSSADGQTWDVLNNTIDPLVDITRFASFKGALWSFGVANDPETGTSSVVFKSTNGVTWTQMATGSWSLADSMAEGRILTSADKMWVIAPVLDLSAKMVWRSTDGINWTQSAANLPSDMPVEPIFFDSKLWCFDFQNKTCWNSSNNGDSWSLITTNLPEMQPEGVDGPIVHEGKLWVEGIAGPVGSPTVYRSTNGADWIVANAFDGGAMLHWGLELISSDSGRLWWVCNDALRIIGGPKQKDGLYYYQKD